MPKSMNPSAIRSREMIVDALLRLMQKKPYTNITITDLAVEAQIVRKTFYRHFYSLDDVLDEYVETLHKEYKEILMNSHITNIYDHIPLYFDFWQKHFDFLTLLHKNNLLIFVLRKYDELIPSICEQLPCRIDHSTLTFEYFSAYTSGGFWKLLCQWIERGGKESPEQMGQIFISFFTMLSTNLYS